MKPLIDPVPTDLIEAELTRERFLRPTNNGDNEIYVVTAVGGYRFIISHSSHPKCMSTEHYFRFTDKFREEYLPYTIELGRSFVQPHYQGSRSNPKGLYSLDNLWDGLGALVVNNPDMRYFFGKVTMYGSYDKEARNILLYFLRKHFPDRENLVEAIHPIEETGILITISDIYPKKSERHFKIRK